MKKFNSFFVLSLLMLPSLISNAQEYLRGDVNYDGQVSISDVSCLIDYLLKGSWPDDNHEYVDLGLPSGTLWATCNVGASCPEEYGDYFAWGETVPKEEYTYENYKWWVFDENGYRYISKYNTRSDFGPVDNKIELEPEDDAACVNWGTSWRMPSLDQVVELVNLCTWQWTERNGVKGHLLTGPNGNTMFLPAAGYRDGSSLEYVGTYGNNWSRALYSYLPDRVYCLYFDSQYWDSEDLGRYYGHVVRAVKVKKGKR
ncbi:MAG: hypothetical protein IKI10_04630 [Muribaculaceae bacterium]|nr:hypothetical protein [Muribaculaceae bacterium]